MIHGPSLNHTIMIYLQACMPLGKVLTEFLDENESCIEFSEVYKYIIRTYARMRGKDITRRIMGQKRRSLSLHTRQKVAAVSDQKTYKKQEEVSEHDELCLITEEVIDSDDESVECE